MDPNKNIDVRWKKNAAAFLVVYSILAAIASVILTTIIAADSTSALKDYWWATILPLGMAIFLFIYTAEKIVDALDEDDVLRYVSLFIFYNLAVILLFWGLIAAIYFKYIYSGHLCSFCDAAKLVVTGAIFLLLTWRWWIHEYWLLTVSSKGFQTYIDELEERATPVFNRQWGFNLFMWLREKWAKKDAIPIFPAIRYDLRRSSINGIGLFSLAEFSVGSFIAEGISAEDLKKQVGWAAFEQSDNTIRAKILDFCIGTPEGFVPPPDYDFNQLTPDWYMNHHCDGNVGFDDNGNFIAIKPIAIGDELTYDYGLAESNPKFFMNCDCGTADCRKVITGNDWKDSIFRKKHVSYMLPSLRQS